MLGSAGPALSEQEALPSLSFGQACAGTRLWAPQLLPFVLWGSLGTRSSTLHSHFPAGQQHGCDFG